MVTVSNSNTKAFIERLHLAQLGQFGDQGSSALRIEAIHIYQHDLPVAGTTYTMSSAALDKLDTTIVEVVTDKGVTGYGETCPVGPTYQPELAAGARAALNELAPHLLGANPLLIGQLHRIMDARLLGHNYAKAAIDIAAWDIMGQHYGARVCDLLGGAVRERVPSYYAVNVGSAEETARTVIEKQKQGFLRIQLKVGGRSAAEDIEVIKRVFEVKHALVDIAVDANRSWTTTQTLEVAGACRELRFVIEQPCATYEEIHQIRPLVGQPIFLDEVTVDLALIMRSIVDGVADGFGLKNTRLGGITPTRAARDICIATRRPFSSDSTWGGDITAAACVHLGATVAPALCAGVWIAAPYIEQHYDLDNGIDVIDGWINVPTGPGLGISPDTSQWTKVASHA